VELMVSNIRPRARKLSAMRHPWAVRIRHGPEHISALLRDLRQILSEHGYRSVAQLRGSFNHRNTPQPGAFERHNYMKALTSYGVELD